MENNEKLQDKVYTIDELTIVLKKNRDTISRYLNSGKLKGVKIGKSWYIKQEYVDEFLTKK